MNSMTWIDAPTGFAGAGGVSLPASHRSAVVGGARIAIAPFVAASRGTGLTLAARLRPIDECGLAYESLLQQASAVAGDVLLRATDLFSATTDNDDTTLGVQPPGRPQS